MEDQHGTSAVSTSLTTASEVQRSTITTVSSSLHTRDKKEFVARNDSIGIPNSKTGTVMSTSLHVFCAIVGASILALPKTFAWLGWVAGPILMWVFFAISMLSSRMLASCYEVNGVEHARYHHAVRHLLGRKSAIVVSCFQIINLFFFSLIFTITAANSMVEIAGLACEYEGKDPKTSPECLSYETGGVWKMSLVFGGVEMLFSQIRNLEEAWWSSLVGSVSGVVYVLILLIIGFANVSNGEGTVEGITTDVQCLDDATGAVTSISTTDKIFGVLNGLGTIAFCFNFSLILLEVQDTLKQPPSAVQQMKKTCLFAIGGSFFCYFMVAVTGYAAQGDCVDSIVLNSYSDPKWALIIAYCNVLINMIMSYQVFGQAMFDTIESQVKWYLLKRKMQQVKLQEPSQGLGTLPEEDGLVIKSPFDRKETGEYGNDISRRGSYGFDHTHVVGPKFSTALSDSVLVHCSAGATGRERTRDTDTFASARSSLRAMFSHDTGFANEEVPLNDDGYVLPCWQRAIIRCTYVLIITILACVLPFFEAVAGLSGAVSFFPMSIYFPFAMYKKVYGHSMSRRFVMFLNVIAVFTFIVGCCATVGSFRNIISSFSDIKIFNT